MRIAIALAALAAAAQTPNGARLRADLDFLTSDALEGRA